MPCKYSLLIFLHCASIIAQIPTYERLRLISIKSTVGERLRNLADHSRVDKTTSKYCYHLLEEAASNGSSFISVIVDNKLLNNSALKLELVEFNLVSLAVLSF